MVHKKARQASKGGWKGSASHGGRAQVRVTAGAEAPKGLHATLKASALRAPVLRARGVPVPPHARIVPAAPRVQVGVASWYGPGLAGRKTTSGIRYNPQRLSAASRSLPLGSVVKVTNLHNRKSVRVVVNDRGPQPRSRIMDLSQAAAARLHMLGRGIARVRIRVLGYVRRYEHYYEHR